ncbi:STAS domain-containing protein [Streptomyces sp. NBC_00247]|uniref:STAS domain-containing protein n=1 Tax=Streptomyces sp. NBC_00247 TaxID=2975689 RepID=UPI002E2DEFDE|nr:STAS domain-containing protein [Streptomyces sp. NBC_00247]
MTTLGGPVGERPLPVVAPHGEIDEDTLEPLRRDIEVALASHGGLVLDATRVTFGDSTFLQLILLTHQRGLLRIAAPSVALRRLFSITGADTVLHLYADLDEALAASSGTGSAPVA